MSEQPIIIKDPTVWWRVNRDAARRLSEEEHRRRRPRVVENPVRALAWIKARKFEPSDQFWEWSLFLHITGMAMVAADAAYAKQVERHEAQREIATLAMGGSNG
jgi:hypothetical protein